MQGVDIVDILLAFVHLPLYPVPVEISEQMMIVCPCCSIAVPLFDVLGEQGFVGVLNDTCVYLLEVTL